MSARIRSFQNGINPIDELSRDDLVVGDAVLLSAIDAATTYAWAILFAPEGSTATFSGSASAVSPGIFTVDLEGPYLIRLTVDAGAGTESTQTVRLRALTAFGALNLVAAGERRDDAGVVPVDVDVEGWANEQNSNLVVLKDFLKPIVASGHILYVDANDGTSNYGNHTTVQAAIDAAVTAGATTSEHWAVLVRPGTYVEDVTFKPFVHVFGWPGNPDGGGTDLTIIQTTGVSTHTADITGTGETTIANLLLVNAAVTTRATLRKQGSGSLRMLAVRVEQNGVNATQGAAVNVTSTGFLRADGCTFVHTVSGAADRPAYTQTGDASSALLLNCDLLGPSGMTLNSGLVATVTTGLSMCRITASGAAGAFGINSSATSLTVDKCVVVAGAFADAVTIHPSAAALVANVLVQINYSSITGDITFDTTGIGGTTTLDISSVIYDNLVFPGGALTSLAASTQAKSIFYDDTLTGLGAANVQDAIDIIGSGASIAPVVYHKNFPEVPNDTVRYRGWAPVASVLLAVRVYMQTVNTQGNFTLTVTNNATGNTALSAASFDMNTLAGATPTTVALTGVTADLTFATLDRWTIELISDDPAFDGNAIYVSLVFNTATASGPVVEDLATTLLTGNITAGTDIVLTIGDLIIGETGHYTTDLVIAPNQTSTHFFFAPSDITIIGVKVYADATPTTAGTYTLAVADADLANNLLTAATEDMTALVAATLTTLTLTGTAANLDVVEGTKISFTLVSDNADLVATSVYAQLLFRRR